MARKKIMFVIVEGPSDEEALGVILNRFYDQNAVHVHIMRKDITSEKGVKPSNIFSKIGDEIRQYARENHFEKKHFQEIIHLVDMDGAYIPDENIVEDEEAVKPVYSETEIRTCNKAGIEERNLQKRENIDKLCSCRDIWTVPYRVFYMSCNLDHVLYNKQNSSDEEKENDSYQFVKQYRDKIPEFVTFIAESDFAVRGSYKESWNYIKQGIHSLERHTNLGLCFKAEKENEQNSGNETLERE